MKYKRNLYHLTDLADALSIKNRCACIETMGCSDSYCKRGNACTLCKFFCFLRICICICLCFQVIFFAANLAKLCLAGNIKDAGYVCNFFCQSYVFLKIKLGAVDHHRGIACVDCLHCKLEAAAMIQVKAYRHTGFFCFRRNKSCIGLNCSIFYCRWCSLNHNRSLQFFGCFYDRFYHLHIFRIKSAYCVSFLLSL